MRTIAGVSPGNADCGYPGGSANAQVRARLEQARVVMLDEATSALDSATEGRIQEVLDELQPTRTVVAIAHRLATIASFDRVVVIVSGRIAEEGPSDLLLRQGASSRRGGNSRTGDWRRSRREGLGSGRARH